MRNQLTLETSEDLSNILKSLYSMVFCREFLTKYLCDLKELVDVRFPRKQRLAGHHFGVEAPDGPNIHFPVIRLFV